MSVVPSASFDWAADPDIVVRPQPAIAIYENGAGAVVIRQEAAWDEDSDIYIIVQPEHCERIAAALLRAAGHELVINNQRRSAAAERARRYRERRKRDASVTDHAGVSDDEGTL